MPTYVLLTRLTSEAIKDPRAFDELGQPVIHKLKAECPEAKWISSYSVLGPYDHLDIFEAPDNDTATTVAVIVRSFGHALTETWAATPWDRFREIVRSSGRIRAKK
jgi:uncharacterized protein with GYD domain